MYENSATDTVAVATKHIIEEKTKTIAYKGADLGYLANQHYGNKGYRQVLSSYNSF